MTAIALTDAEWSAPCVSLPRETMCVGTPIALVGYTRPLVMRELAWLHAALTAALGRDHDRRRTMRVADWTLVPWSAPSGWAVAWWSEADAAAMTGTVRPSRIGAVDCSLALGTRVRVHVPPAYVPGVHLARLTLRTPMVVQSDHRTITRRTADSRTLTSALWTLARKLRVAPAALALSTLDDRTRCETVDVRGKLGRVEGPVGAVDVACNAPARWLLECASRGLGMGGRTAYGFGRVEAVTLAR